MEINVLGPLQISGTQRSTGLPGWRQRVVLAALALNANRVTTLDRLLDAVWGGRPPGTPRTQIQICVSGLRKLLRETGCAARIVTRTPGYVLEVDEEDLDHRVVERLIATARTHEAAGRLEEAVSSLRGALRLRRGPALVDVPGDAIAAAAHRLDEQLVAAEGTLFRLELALGRHNEVIAGLRRLLAQHPLREELYRDLMLALYRAGRQPEALAAFQQARLVLAEQAGVAPSEGLRRLEHAILTGDEELAVPRPATAPPGEAGDQLPAGVADFTGREQPLAETLDLLRHGHGDPAGFLPVVGLSGRPGVGKSCLAVQAAHILSESFPDGHLYADLGTVRRDGRGFEILGRFLTSLGVPADQLPGTLRLRREAYRARLTGRRVLVVVDGAGHEDDVVPLLPGVPGCGVIVTSSRALTTVPGSRWLHLVALDEAQSRLLLTRMLGATRTTAEREASQQVVRLCAGSPLALRIAGTRLMSRPHLRMAELARSLADARTRLDELSHGALDMRGVLAAGYESLGPEARVLFRRLGLMPTREFAESAMATLLGTDAAAGRAVAESLVDAAMLDVVACPGSVEVRYRLDPLLRLYAQERLAREEPRESVPDLTPRVVPGTAPQHDSTPARNAPVTDRYPPMRCR